MRPRQDPSIIPCVVETGTDTTSDGKRDQQATATTGTHPGGAQEEPTTLEEYLGSGAYATVHSGKYKEETLFQIWKRQQIVKFLLKMNLKR